MLGEDRLAGIADDVANVTFLKWLKFEAKQQSGDQAA